MKKINNATFEILIDGAVISRGLTSRDTRRALKALGGPALGYSARLEVRRPDFLPAEQSTVGEWAAALRADGRM